MKPRIVLLLSTFPQISETFIVQKFVGLVDAGWDVRIACAGFSEKAWLAYESLRARPDLRTRVRQSPPSRSKLMAALLLIPVLTYTLLVSPQHAIRYLRRGWRERRWGVFRNFYLDAAIIQGQPDLLHFEFGTLAVGREYLGEWLGCKTVISFRGYDLNFSGLDNPDYYTKVWRSADALHLLGSDLWQRAVRRGCPPDKLHALIPPAIDSTLFTPPARARVDVGTPERPLRILSVGRLEWKKGYEFALQAVQQAVEPSVILQGIGRQKAQHQRKSHRL